MSQYHYLYFRSLFRMQTTLVQQSCGSCTRGTRLTMSLQHAETPFRSTSRWVSCHSNCGFHVSWLINLFVFIFGYCFININWRDVQRKNVVNNVGMSSLWARWQNGPHKKKQNSTKRAKQQYWRTLGINCWLPINSLSTIFTDPRFTKSFIWGFDTYWFCIQMYYGLLSLHYNFLLIWNVSKIHLSFN